MTRAQELSPKRRPKHWLLEASQWWAKRLQPLPSAIAGNKEVLPARKNYNLLEHRYECNGGLASPAPQCAHRSWGRQKNQCCSCMLLTADGQQVQLLGKLHLSSSWKSFSAALCTWHLWDCICSTVLSFMNTKETCPITPLKRCMWSYIICRLCPESCKCWVRTLNRWELQLKKKIKALGMLTLWGLCFPTAHYLQRGWLSGKQVANDGAANEWAALANVIADRIMLRKTCFVLL